MERSTNPAHQDGANHHPLESDVAWVVGATCTPLHDGKALSATHPCTSSPASGTGTVTDCPTATLYVRVPGGASPVTLNLHTPVDDSAQLSSVLPWLSGDTLNDTVDTQPVNADASTNAANP